ICRGCGTNCNRHSRWKSSGTKSRCAPNPMVWSLAFVKSDFDSVSAAVRANSRSAFGRIASLLAQREYRIRMEGHTDNGPIHNAKFSDNWELSTARATELVRLLIVQYHFAPQRLSAAGSPSITR